MTAPGLFTANGTGKGTGYYYTEGGLFPEVSSAVQAGDIVVLYGTGFGVTNPAVATGVLGPNTAAGATATVTMTVNNQSVPVTFAGLEPGNSTSAALGYDEVVFTVPSGLPIPAGQGQASFPVVVTVGGVASQSVNLIVATTAPSITSISPSTLPLSTSPITVTFNGTSFQSGLTLALVSPSGQKTTLSGSSITFVSSTQFTAQITTGTTAGTWGAVVTNPDGGQSDTFVFTTSASASGSQITAVVTASSEAAQIAPNTWLEVYGVNLATSTGNWNNANFQNGLPTTINGVSATVNSKPAAVFFVSPGQVNILAPIDTATGTVTVQLNTPTGATNIFTVNEQATSPAFFAVNKYVAAVNYPSGTLVGAASLSQPGYPYAPAARGAIVELYGTGFGQPNPAITNEQTGTGQLPTLPTVTIGGVPANVISATLIGPGLYQLNVTVPPSAGTGDQLVVAMYNGLSTQGNVYITLQ